MNASAYRVDVSALSFDEFRALLDAGTPPLERIALLERAVGRIGHLPLSEFPRAMRAVEEVFEQCAGDGNLLKRVLAHLWTQGSAPVEYVELLLCRDVYHCPPDVLARQPARTVLRHLTCLRAEAVVQRAQARKLRARGRTAAR